MSTLVPPCMRAALLALSMALAACAARDSSDATGTTSTEPVGAAREEAPRECDAEPVQYAVGQPYTPELGEKIRELSHSTVVRTLRPGQIVTMEYRFDRVSVHLDDKDVVTMVTCG